MKKSPVSRWMEHPLTSLSLVVVAVVLTVSWRRAASAFDAPTVSNYSWIQHTKTLMIVQPSKDCGCGGMPEAAIKAALKNGWDVLYLTSAMTSDLETLQQEFLSSKHFLLLSHTQPALIKKFAPGDRSIFFLIREGEIKQKFSSAGNTENYLVMEGSTDGSES